MCTRACTHARTHAHSDFYTDTRKNRQASKWVLFYSVEAARTWLQTWPDGELMLWEQYLCSRHFQDSQFLESVIVSNLKEHLTQIQNSDNQRLSLLGRCLMHSSPSQNSMNNWKWSFYHPRKRRVILDPRKWKFPHHSAKKPTKSLPGQETKK